MRMSAASCWCSLLAADAGAGNPVATTKLATKARKHESKRFLVFSRFRGLIPSASIWPVISPFPESSFGGNHEVRAAVLLPRGLVVPGIERELLAVAHRPQPVGGNAKRHQVGACGDGAPFAQCQIVLGGATLVA